MSNAKKEKEMTTWITNEDQTGLVEANIPDLGSDVLEKLEIEAAEAGDFELVILCRRELKRRS